ncbi:MAG: protein kinase [Acidobacteriota bacterium]|nr:protein kinase [Acidobacteriota bacterium]
MSLTSGQRLGAYEILSPLGAGGMGEVYRARDTKLNRDVAIKVLLPAVASDPDRLARFSREAQVLASLNHPNIAHIHGLEESGGVTALVLELVEGEDLAQRIARGPIPLDEALPIARQIAEALEAAHDHGIIHRDLKPANLKVRPDGTVKVLDFGLAKAVDPTAGSSATAMNSPTLSIHATQAGIILGTAAYMSPEQARAKSVDKRTDIWALGCVLFEMLTGQRAFPGDDATDTIVAVVSKEPDWNALPPGVSPSIRRLLRKSLEKDPKRRLDSAAGVRIDIDDALAGPSVADGAAVQHRVAQRPTWSRALPWAIAGALALALVVVWAPWRQTTTIAPSALVRLSAELGADASLSFRSGDATALSPDGTLIAFVAEKDGDGTTLLYVRRLDQLQATALSGTDDAMSPFFSPDGEWLGFFAGGKLKKVAVSGGTAITLCDAPGGRGGGWGEDGTIVFAPTSNPGAPLMRVPSAGGPPEPMATLADGEVSQRWPQVLPGGRGVLFTSSSVNTAYNDASIVVQSSSGARSIVQRGGYHGRYVASGPGTPKRSEREEGHLVYLRDGTLFAAPFDVTRLAVTGPSVPVLEGVTSNIGTGGAQFAVSDSGALVFLPGQTNSGGGPITWMDRAGKTTPLRAAHAAWFDLLFSPDGRRLAMQLVDGTSTDIWIYEWARDSLTRLTFGATYAGKPVWTPDGGRIVYNAPRPDQTASNLVWQRADGTGDAQRLTEGDNHQRPASWHPSGKFLAFEERNQAGFDLMILPMAGDEAAGWKPGTPTVFLNSPAQEREPMFSPDGRWLAYISEESGRSELYARPFPGPGGKWQISTSGAMHPTWSRTKPELFYGTPLGQIMVVPYAVEGDSLRAEKPRLWSDGRYFVRGQNRMFDLHPDGMRFALAPSALDSGVKHDKLTFLFNFFDHLRQIAPVTKP